MLTREDAQTLSGYLPVWEKLGEEERRTIVSSAVCSEIEKGEAVLGRGRECSGLIVVKEGQLRAFFESEDGKEITLYRLLNGDICILSASCVLKNITFEVTLEAEKDSQIYRIPAALWGKLSEGNPAVKEFTMELVSGRFSEVMWVMEQIVSRNMGQRIAAFLTEQAALEGSEALSMTHETVAKNLGTAREVVSRTLKYFENDGLVRLQRGQVILLDRKKLLEMSR